MVSSCLLQNFSRRGAKAQRTQRAICNEKVRYFFYSYFHYKNKKNKKENAKLGNNASFSAPPRALREEFLISLCVLCELSAFVRFIGNIFIDVAVC